MLMYRQVKDGIFKSLLIRRFERNLIFFAIKCLVFISARSWAHALDIKNAQVYQVSGLKLVGSYEIKEDDGYDYENFKEKKNTDDEAKESEKEEE